MAYTPIMTRGEDIMDAMLLEQYQKSPNLREYFMCFFEEMNLLLATSEQSYRTRLILDAEGESLDIIGRILQQERNVVITQEYFGFQGATGALGFNDGTFKDENELGFTVTPLTDSVYRNLLLGKAYVLNKDNCSVEDVYNIVRIVTGKALSTLTITYPGDRQFQLNLSATEVTLPQHALIQYASEWFVPNGITFTISRL